MSLPVIDVPKYTTELPSTGQKVTYRPFIVKEQKQLLMAVNGDASEQVAAVEDIISACTFGKINPTKLPAFDLEHLFLQIRARSIGEKVDIVCTCPECKEPHNHTLDLTNVSVVKPEGHEYNIELSDGILLKMKDPDLKSVDELKRNYDADGIITLIARSIDSIWQNDELYAATDYSLGELIEFVENFSPQNLTKVEDFFDTLPTLKHSIDYECEKCKATNHVVLEGLQDFFG